MSRIHDLAAQALTLLPPETAHSAALAALKAGLGPRNRLDDEGLVTALAGMRLANPIGLAAGFDKNAEVHAQMLAAGFGFVECGTVTPLPQSGNPRPRMFRLRADRAVINRLGFNNHGLPAFAAGLARRRGGGVVGANVGANKDSTDRIADYVMAVTRLWGRCDYLTMNVSSPNTPGLRDLQLRTALDDLLGAVSEATADLRAVRATPLFLKVSPDIAEAQIEDIVEAGVRHGLAGLVVSNTTLARPAGLRSPSRTQGGGLSGAPLMAPSTRLLTAFHDAARGRLDLVGVGGVASGAEAYAKIRAGAKAVQLYTAVAFEGLGLIRRMGAELAARLRADGFASLDQAVGAR